MVVDEGKRELPVCVDFLGTNLINEIIVTLTTVTGGAQGAQGAAIIEAFIAL